MTGLNHAATGVLVAVAINKPAIALPVALLSHFVIDVIPHWDYKIGDNPAYRQLAMMMDLTLSLSLLLVLSVTVGDSARTVIACGFLAMLPDAMWLPEIVQGKKLRLKGPGLLYKLRRAHSKLSWHESKPGLYIEIAWFVAMIALIITIG